MREKRKYTRTDHHILFTLKIEGQTYAGVTGNLSQGGAYAESISPSLDEAMVGTSGDITLHIEPDPITMRCRIVYVGGGAIPHPAGVGIAFLD